MLESYRAYLLGTKRKSRLEQIASARRMNPNADIVHLTGTARSLVHYKDLLQEYLAAKRDMVKGAK